MKFFLNIFGFGAHIFYGGDDVPFFALSVTWFV